MIVITIIDAGPARRLIPWCSALIHIRGKLATNPLAGIYRNIFYIGVHREPNYKIYWETLKPNRPIHAIPKHMSLN